MAKGAFFVTGRAAVSLKGTAKLIAMSGDTVARLDLSTLEAGDVKLETCELDTWAGSGHYIVTINVDITDALLAGASDPYGA